MNAWRTLILTSIAVVELFIIERHHRNMMNQDYCFGHEPYLCLELQFQGLGALLVTRRHIYGPLAPATGLRRFSSDGPLLLVRAVGRDDDGLLKHCPSRGFGSMEI